MAARRAQVSRWRVRAPPGYVLERRHLVKFGNTTNSAPYNTHRRPEGRIGRLANVGQRPRQAQGASLEKGAPRTHPEAECARCGLHATWMRRQRQHPRNREPLESSHMCLTPYRLAALPRSTRPPPPLSEWDPTQTLSTRREVRSSSGRHHAPPQSCAAEIVCGTRAPANQGEWREDVRSESLLCMVDVHPMRRPVVTGLKGYTKRLALQERRLAGPRACALGCQSVRPPCKWSGHCVG